MKGLCCNRMVSAALFLIIVFFVLLFFNFLCYLFDNFFINPIEKESIKKMFESGNIILTKKNKDGSVEYQEIKKTN